VTQTQAVRLVRAIAQVLRATQAQSLALRVRNSSLTLAVTQTTSARLAQVSTSITQRVLQQSSALLVQLARLTRTAQQAAESLTLTLGGQVLQRTGTTTQATNVSLLKAPVVVGTVQQAQAVSLIVGTGISAAAAQQAQTCTLILQPLPRTPVQPARVFTACRARRLVYAAPARNTTFQVRPRQTIFVARFS
jgi:hypothetical protein